MSVEPAEVEGIQAAIDNKDEKTLSLMALGLAGFRLPKIKPPKIKPPKIKPPKIKGPKAGRKARYCITCGDGTKHDIQAYGDLHAIAIGAAKCGSFSMQNGRCKKKKKDE
jgi:hypothetical protein